MLPTVLSPGTQARQYAAAGAGGGGGFSPLSLSPLVWFDASVANSLFQDTGGTTPATADADPVGLWKDQSGNANNATSATSTNKPTLKLAIKNGKNVVRFDGVNDRVKTVALSLGQTWTSFAAAIGPASAMAQQILIATESNSLSFHGFLYFANATTMRAQGYNTLQTYFLTDKTIPANTWALQSSLVNSAVTCYVNGSGSTPATITGTPMSGSFTLSIGYFGEIYFLAGDIAEVLFFNSGLSDTDRQSVESYLNAKWAIY